MKLEQRRTKERLSILLQRFVGAEVEAHGAVYVLSILLQRFEENVRLNGLGNVTFNSLAEIPSGASTAT